MDRWVAKQDVGTMGYAEKEKSQASDSFKRACFNWGIGRELYTAPFIWIPAMGADIRRKDGRFNCNDRFSVRKIAYGGSREIISLVIANDTRGKTVFEFRSPGGANARKEEEAKEKDKNAASGAITEAQLNSLEAELERTGVEIEAVKKRYKIGEPRNMTEEIYAKVMRALAKTKSIEAA